MTICRARKAHCRPHLQGLAATGAEVSKGPRGRGAKRQAHPIMLPVFKAVSSTSRRLSRQLFEESRSGTSSPATKLRHHLHNSPSLAFHPDNDFMKRLPPIPRSAKPLHRHPGPLACWRRLTPFGTLAGQTRGRLALRVSLGTASDCHHGTRHFTQCLLATATRLSPFPIPSTDPDANTFDLRPLPAVGRRSDSPRCRSSADRSPPPRNLYGSRVFGPQAAEE